MSDPDLLSGNLLGATDFASAAMMTRVALESETDELGHINNAVYLTWAQDIAVAHWRRMASEDLQRKYIWMALRHEIDYRDQIFAGDQVELRTWLGEAAGARYSRHIDIRRVGAKRPAAKVLTVWCLIDAETRKPRRVGREIFEPFGFTE